MDAIAQIPSGDKDRAQVCPYDVHVIDTSNQIVTKLTDIFVEKIFISAVMGISCNGTQFSSPLYDFPVAERTTGIVGHVELRSTDTATADYTMSISSCSPPSMRGSLNTRHVFDLPDRITFVKLDGRKTNKLIDLIFQDSFDVTPNGDIVVVRPFNWTNSRTRIVLTISAEQKTNSRIMPISTIVNIDVLDINEAPQFLGYGPSVVIGYPARTYFDPSVQMPLVTVKVTGILPQFGLFIRYFQTLGV